MLTPSCSHLQHTPSLQPFVVGCSKRPRTDQTKSRTTCCMCRPSGHEAHAGMPAHVVHVFAATCKHEYAFISDKHYLCPALSRRQLLHALLVLSASGAGSAAANPAQMPMSLDGPSALTDQQQGVPAVLEGKAKQAVEQALRKSVDKTKVQAPSASLVPFEMVCRPPRSQAGCCHKSCCHVQSVASTRYLTCIGPHAYFTKTLHLPNFTAYSSWSAC